METLTKCPNNICFKVQVQRKSFFKNCVFNILKIYKKTFLQIIFFSVPLHFFVFHRSKQSLKVLVNIIIKTLVLFIILIIKYGLCLS